MSRLLLLLFVAFGFAGRRKLSHNKERTKRKEEDVCSFARRLVCVLVSSLVRLCQCVDNAQGRRRLETKQTEKKEYVTDSVLVL